MAKRDRGRKRVLIVDDEETVGLGMSEILRDEGYEAHYVTDGRSAIEELKRRDYDMVFMDIVMPGLNGLDTYRELKKIKKDIKVVIFTGYFKDAEDVITQGVKEGMIDDFIRKPYFADEIIRSVRRHAEKRR